MIIGTHIIAELKNIDTNKFIELSKDNQYDKFNNYVLESLLKNNVKVLDYTVHHFSNEGAFTSLYLLSESHLSFHTWPEYNYIALDIFTCGNSNIEQIFDDIVKYLNPESVDKKLIKRGCQLKNPKQLQQHNSSS